MPFELPTNERCPFCRNIAGEVETAVVVDDGETYAFVNPRMFGLGHVLVIPKRHAGLPPWPPAGCEASSWRRWHGWTRFNNRRLFGALDYVPPAEDEASWQAAPLPAAAGTQR